MSVNVKIKDIKDDEFDAVVKSVSKSEIRALSKSWKFNWLALYTKKGKFYQIQYDNEVQGLIKLEEENDSYFVLKNIEVSPSNYGKKGRYKNIAEILMSYACLKSFELNTGNYKGYLVFTSKGELIEYYQTKYQAQLIFRERMMIEPQQGKELILNNLKIDLTDE